ncbi:hypothetical protein B0T16DRAFT_459680 [Cercophora newfieldiana]|uniref:Uncharacterized protein n=1 Tax=Cercophora newfieldiana TaxID=92897 RepID=A0AA39Y061_9PEZI|nr:hypothetical protein B0T16DRAFT_459680 [Cercophora newfieldiana]
MDPNDPNDDYDPDSVSSAYSSAICTPTTSTTTFTLPPSPPPTIPPSLSPSLPFPTTISPSRITRDAPPWPSTTHAYILLHLPSQRPLTLHNGKPILSPLSDSSPPPGCPTWIISEEDGWLGLRNAASGKQLGRNWPGEVVAEADHHKWWEFLCARRHPEGGYVLLIVNCVAHAMEKIGVADDGRSLALRKGEPARWEFIKVES